MKSTGQVTLPRLKPSASCFLSAFPKVWWCKKYLEHEPKTMQPKTAWLPLEWWWPWTVELVWYIAGRGAGKTHRQHSWESSISLDLILKSGYGHIYEKTDKKCKLKRRYWNFLQCIPQMSLKRDIQVVLSKNSQWPCSVWLLHGHINVVECSGSLWHSHTCTCVVVFYKKGEKVSVLRMPFKCLRGFSDKDLLNFRKVLFQYWSKLTWDHSAPKKEVLVLVFLK